MTNPPTPSPAPASGAETPRMCKAASLDAGGAMHRCGYRMDAHNIYQHQSMAGYFWPIEDDDEMPAAPTPESPREAGRETDVVCQCGHARSCHGTVFQTPSEKTGACLANERCLCLVYRAAAPTAEGSCCGTCWSSRCDAGGAAACAALRSNGTTDGHEPDVLPQGMTFHAGDLAAAYVAGAKSARQHHPVSDDLIIKSVDAYVKHAHLVRIGT